MEKNTCTLCIFKFVYFAQFNSRCIFWTGYISSVLHLNASSAWAFFLFFVSKRRFSKPVDRSTPSHRYPGRMPKRLGGGSGPLYTGYSAKKKIIRVITTLTTWVPYTRNRKIGIIKLSISDVMVGQKGSNGDQKLQLFGRDYNFTCTLRKIHLWAKIRN